ncbi:MAG: TIGR00341 family protein [Geobacteraceae bacterium GWF2_54_21]|nr:MAG: TIGR00341 family protein [Geobacteraceae bacterium GWF2_54_21]HBA72599.1 TIGR00341 family protein [Geobacter sp.]
MNAHILYQIKKLKDYLAIKTEMVNHQAIIKDVASGVDRSWIYYLMLLSAGLIALLGLLTNSVAVVIGAMLISPLMGPIISSGLALTIGDLRLAGRAFRTIAVSVALTILISALVTLISPLKEPTAEIMARVRPNIYDLFVAVISGVVGTVALCTKRNYLITATGVAVATAVIPPLSVVGYGLGTGQLMLAMGGFLLFFTNFVAIILTSDLVFFILGFRTTHVEAIQYSPRKRLLIIAGLLTLISIPLVYTLVVDLKKVNTKKRIERVLKKQLNRELASRMTNYFYLGKNGRIQVNASVNTVKLIDSHLKEQIEAELTKVVKTPVNLHLEQVIVASEKLPVQISQTEMATGMVTSPPRIDTPAEIRGKVNLMSEQVEAELTAALDPFPVSSTRITFAGGDSPLLITLDLRRDYPVGGDERLLLSRLVQRTLELPVVLAINELPLLPILKFSKDGSLTPDSVKNLTIITRLPGGPVGFRFLLEGSRKNGNDLSVLKKYLTGELKVPQELISTSHPAGNTYGDNGVKLQIIRHQEMQ